MIAHSTGSMLAALNKGPGHRLLAWNSAMIYSMIFTQPVYYELPALEVPTILMIGDVAPRQLAVI